MTARPHERSHEWAPARARRARVESGVHTGRVKVTPDSSRAQARKPESEGRACASTGVFRRLRGFDPASGRHVPLPVAEPECPATGKWCCRPVPGRCRLQQLRRSSELRVRGGSSLKLRRKFSRTTPTAAQSPIGPRCWSCWRTTARRLKLRRNRRASRRARSFVSVSLVSCGISAFESESESDSEASAGSSGATCASATAWSH